MRYLQQQSIFDGHCRSQQPYFCLRYNKSLVVQLYTRRFKRVLDVSVQSNRYDS